MPLAAATIGSGLLSAGASMWGASQQGKAAKSANKLQAYMWGEQMKRAQPFVDSGIGALSTIGAMSSYFNNPIVMDQAALEQTPGYQFTRDQGLKSLQNSYAAKGLGSSGAALKGAADFTTGLANKTYLDQYNVERQNRNDIFSRLLGQATLGGNIASGVGTQSAAVGQSMAGNITGAANAQAAAGLNAANQIGSGLTSALLFNRLLGNGSGGGGFYGSGSTGGTSSDWWG